MEVEMMVYRQGNRNSVDVFNTCWYDVRAFQEELGIYRYGKSWYSKVETEELDEFLYYNKPHILAREVIKLAGNSNK